MSVPIEFFNRFDQKRIMRVRAARRNQKMRFAASSSIGTFLVGIGFLLGGLSMLEGEFGGAIFVWFISAICLIDIYKPKKQKPIKWQYPKEHGS